MTKFAHISNRPGHEVGEKVLALCGKEFKVKALWADIPVEKPICRPCVDKALKALTPYVTAAAPVPATRA